MGALMDALIAPEGDRKKQAVRSIAGVVAAVFVGGFFAGMVAHLVADPAYAYLASGYICGHGGQAAMRVAQKKILGKGHPNVD